MSRTFRKNIGLSVVTSVIALALSGVPFSLDTHSGSPGINAAIAAPGNGNGKGQANGNGKSRGAEKSQQAKAAHAKGHVSKDDPMHPSNLGRLNGFLNASPQALKNTSANSAIGVLSKTYRDALLGYTTSSEESEETVSTEDLAAILAKAYNLPPDVATSAIDNILKMNPGWWNRGELKRPQMEAMAEALGSVGALELPVDWTAAINDSFIPPTAKTQ